MFIGFSNGNFHQFFQKNIEKHSLECINFCKVEGEANAIELHASSEEEINYLLKIGKDKLKYFKYVSFHTPSFLYKNNKNTRKILQKFSLLREKLAIQNFVFHTDKKNDWTFLSSYNIPISVENMDNKKNYGKTIEEMKKILEKYNFGLTLDLQHCYTNDKKMKLTKNFHEELGEKIKEYHLSGFSKNKNHAPLFKTEEKEIIFSLKKRNIPIILEGVFSSLKDAKKELIYVKKNLRKNFKQKNLF